MTQFEAWKASLTLTDLGKIANQLANCVVCPAREYCKRVGRDRWCSTKIKEWGEKDAE